jgi:peptidyl-prolyl cis-trans isomerase B (cyclophilin B)
VKLARSHRLAGLLICLALLMTAAALGGCATTASSEAESDQMHANAPLESPENTEEPAAVFEEETMHVSTVNVTGTETAIIQTSKGTIKLALYPADAPNTVASFIELADSGFYDGLKFHRVISGFVAQGGDPLTRDLTVEQIRAGVGGAGTGGPGWTQKAEFNSRKHETGTLAMARAQHPDSAGSQFYICLAPQPSLDGQYTVFGQVTEGMDVVHAIEVGDTIESITIEH